MSVEPAQSHGRFDVSAVPDGLPERVGRHFLAGESLDRLCTVELRARGMPRGYLTRLYAAARKHYGSPLGLLAANRLQTAFPTGALRVVIATGAGRPLVQPKGETDGPIGTALLARALHVSVGAVPVFVCGEEFSEPVVAAGEAAGFTFGPLHDAPKRAFGAVLQVVPLPPDQQEAERANSILEEVQPAAVIAIERPGPNSRGVTHSTLGTASPTPVGTIAALVQRARRQGLLTVAIGDAGNEVGFGAIAEAVRTIHPLGAQCRCPCGSGVACVVPADALVVASCSNLGAYNVAACLSLLCDSPEALVTPDLEARVFEACVRAGAEEATHGRALWCDGVPIEAHSAFIRLIREVVEVEHRRADRSW